MLNHADLPEYLVVAVDENQVSAVVEWWNGLTDTQRHELIHDASNKPDNIASQADIGYSPDDEEPNEWVGMIRLQKALRHEHMALLDFMEGAFS